MGPVLNSSFLSMKRLGVLLLPPGWDASPLQGYPQHICWYPFVHLGEEKHCESKVSYLRTWHNDPGQGLNQDHPVPTSPVPTLNGKSTKNTLIWLDKTPMMWCEVKEVEK